jgi:hypothetical protein
MILPDPGARDLCNDAGSFRLQTSWRSPALFVVPCDEAPPAVARMATRTGLSRCRWLYPEQVYAAPKKSGKTGFAAIHTLATVLRFGGKYAEGYCVANDLEQAQGRVFQAVSRIVESSPLLASAKITKDRIDFPKFGNASIQAIASDRMKAGREHRVPLSGRALAIVKALRQAAERCEFVFAGHKPGKPLSGEALRMVLQRMKIADVTVHGFRSAFRDWAAECTNFTNEVCEAALAHAVTNKVEAAYRRGDLFEKRRKLMDAWAAFCRAPKTAGKIVPMRRKG